MKFTIPAKRLTDALAAMTKVVERRNTIPILGNVLLKADAGALRLMATDLDLQLSVEIEAEVEKPGDTTVQATLLSDIARKMSGDVTVSQPDGTQMVTVSAGRSRFNLNCLPSSDFPLLNAGTFTHSFKMTGTGLHAALSKVEFAISTEETRYYLNGIYMHHMQDGGEEKLRFVATDGHRLARNEAPAPDGSEGMPGIIIPRKAVKEIVSLASSVKDQDVAIDVSDMKIRFTSGKAELVSKLIDGTFPDYQRVIPQMNNMHAKVDAKTIAAASERVSTVSSERGRAVKFSLEPGQLTLSVSSPDSGQAEDVIDLDYDADPMSIGFNARYFADVCGVLGAGEMKIHLIDSGQPAVFTNDEIGSLLLVLMPMRI